MSVDAGFGNYVSPTLPLSVFRFVVVGYADADAKSDFGTAITAFLGLDESALRSASVPIPASPITSATA
ncbi:hypothetical protein ACFVIL_43110 [Streptomyces sp. NPDC127159]|uniref:hypothetical protein n=1 Tax=unclassified Streptomyces TaxID=2593676 RepID=UPI0036324570